MSEKAMDYETVKALDEMSAFIDEKRKAYKDVKGMESFIDYLEESNVNIALRVVLGDVDADWLKAVKSDITRTERNCKYTAGLLTPEEAEAYKKRRDFFLGKPDLPEWVK